jgi:hypothetical protein
MGAPQASVPSGDGAGNGIEMSFMRGVNADHAPVRTDCSRRTVLQLGSLAGLAALASGCAGGGGGTQANGEDLPSPTWPDPVKGPRPVPPPPPNGAQIAKVEPRPPQQPITQTPTPTPTGLPTGVIPRTRWTTAGLKRPSNVRPMNGTTYITVHHDGMNAFTGESESDSIKRLTSIQGSHTQRKAKTGEYWADIGYHYIIDRAGRVWEGRPIVYQGAHVQDCNEHNIGVMCMGNFMIQYPTKAQTDRLDQFVAQLMRDHRISLRNVRTHREWNPTECPGQNLQVYMARTRSRGGNMALALAASDPSLLA